MVNWQHAIVRYTGAGALTAIAWGVWSLGGAMHNAPFILFVAAVVVSARFLGFGPAIFSTILSVIIIDFAVLPPAFTFSRPSRELAEVAVFLVLALFTATLARQKSKAEVETDDAQQ